MGGGGGVEIETYRGMLNGFLFLKETLFVGGGGEGIVNDRYGTEILISKM